MYAVLGANGHVGSAVVDALSESGNRILALVHSDEKTQWSPHINVEAIRVDVTDTEALRAVFERATRAFLLNPPAAPSSDTNAHELNTARAIAKTVNRSGLEKVVVASTYGAQAGDGVGDLSVLYEFERLVEASGIPTAINRGAYYFSNLDSLIESARQGALPTMFPATMKLPMVAPADLGKAAAERLTSPVSDVGVQHVEGPEAYSFSEVAAALTTRLGRAVAVRSIPRDEWQKALKSKGFSPEAAEAYAKMTAATIDDPYQPYKPQRGRISLKDYLTWL
jgi:uncharacterized protein YbjT (DUF2867 family)